MIFAIAVLLLVAVALLTATTAGISGQKASEFQVISNNLARESIEVVRSLRDGNWLSGQPWDQDLKSTEAKITVFDPGDPELEPPVPASWKLTSGDSRLFLENNFYTHQPLDPTLNSTYARTVAIDSICQNTQGEETIVQGDCGSDIRIGIQVRAQVSWVDRGRDTSIEITDLLYAWR